MPCDEICGCWCTDCRSFYRNCRGTCPDSDD
jgi:hypothetical protein